MIINILIFSMLGFAIALIIASYIMYKKDEKFKKKEGGVRYKRRS